MTPLEKKFLHLLAQVSMRNVLSSTTDALQTEIHNLLITHLDPEYRNFLTKTLEDKINSL